MRKIDFTKMVASGNDFVVISGGLGPGARSLGNFAKSICDRKFGVGADGLLLLEKSRRVNIRMRIFNADGSEAEMCGNGARCAALFVASNIHVPSSRLKIETKAGIVSAVVNKNNVRINLTDPKSLRMEVPVKLNNRTIRADFINTGVPHTVIFVEGIEGIDVSGLGRQIRYHRQFAPAGTNVDFLQVETSDTIRVRTYERGVEDETLACGTGSVASALIYALKSGVTSKINVRTAGGEILKVYFARCGNNFKNVWLEGLARIVYTGVYHV